MNWRFGARLFVVGFVMAVLAGLFAATPVHGRLTNPSVIMTIAVKFFAATGIFVMFCAGLYFCVIVFMRFWSK